LGLITQKLSVRILLSFLIAAPTGPGCDILLEPPSRRPCMANSIQVCSSICIAVMISVRWFGICIHNFSIISGFDILLKTS